MRAQDLAFPLGLAFGQVAKARTWLYQNDYLKREKASVPVISIGNLTMGGTGKTPVLIALGQLLKGSAAVGVVSRGYGAEQQSVSEVRVSDPRAAQKFGDEPTLIARELQSPVYIAPQRSSACAELLKHHPVRCILADDAFQHQALRRDLDIVVLDALEPSSAYRPIPWGRAREGFGALKRAHWIVLTKSNLAEASHVQWLLEQIPSQLRHKVVRADYSLSQLRPLGVGGTIRRVVLVSGIGRPESFAALLARNPGLEVVHHAIYPDHHPYSDMDAQKLNECLKKWRAEALITTSKDEMKLAAFGSLRERLWVADLQLQFSGPTKELHEDLLRLAR